MVTPDMPLKRICPVCQSSAASKIGARDGFVWRRCGICRTLYVDRPPTKQEICALYSGYYDEENLDVPPFVHERLDEIVASFAAMRQTGRLLDVGFGAGTLLAAAERAGWDCWGTEISEEAVATAASPTWRVFAGDLLELGLPAGSFDVVCLVEVLEHLEHPLSYFSEARRLLRPGGLLYGTTPNGGGLSARRLGCSWSVMTPPEHLELFTRSSLLRALSSSGFSKAKVRTSGLNLSELRAARGAPVSGNHRVAQSYGLNAALTANAAGRLFKRGANAVLDISGLGDSLRVTARRV